MGWTPDQKKAIETDTGSGNLLVSAAAGSGKTAVLVERVLRKILNGKSTVDRLLIVTFTEAAASEMRQKIVKRLSEYVRNREGDDETLRLVKAQISLAQTADIMTIDGFCNRVVQNNFHALGIDPNIQICDEGMEKLLMAEAMDSLFARIYKSDDGDTLSRLKRLTDFYAKDRSNEGLANVILSIYRFTESFADPEKWLSDAVSELDLPVLMQAVIRYHEEITRKTAQVVSDELMNISETADDAVIECAAMVRSVAQTICNATSWDEIYSVYQDLFSKPKKRTEFISVAQSLPESEDRDVILFSASLLCDIFSAGKTDKTPFGIYMSSEDIATAHNSELLKEEASDLTQITNEFITEFSNIKSARNLYSFSDIEHLTFRLFNENESIRKEYRDKYDEILIDEYQDTNSLQDSIFSLISKNNIFMVGDLKQSIYRFRKGDPYIFKSKAYDYALDDNENQRIMLSQNFRSRTEILDSVNDIFAKVMSETAGDVDYKDGELIVRDNEYEYYPQTKSDMKSELHYIALDKSAAIDRDVYEARYTARLIKKLLDSNTQVYDKNLECMRPIQKKDIVILENSLKYNSEIITDELSALGIASYVDKSSFFDRREISIMLSIVSVIDNSHNDIPLLSVMRSPIGGFSDEDLAKIRINDKSAKNFIDAVKTYADNGEDNRLGAHCGVFLKNIRRWRDYVRKKSVAQLIWAIYEETCFYDIMGAIEGGKEAQTNLRLLYDRAKQYESAGFKGLFNFIRYINQIESSSNDLNGAKLISENHDVVRIMTIHKSKGLEFPYVFLLGAGREFPTKQDSSVIRMHKNLGFGLPYIYYEKHYSQKSRAFDLITKVNKAEGISERMRLLYVALTRPREKLYVIIAKNHTQGTTEEDIVSGWKNMLTGNKMLPSLALGAKGFYDWLCPAAYASPNTWKVHYTYSESMPDRDDIETKFSESDFQNSTDLSNAVSEILDYKYPYYESNTIVSRTSVTQLKELSRENETEYEPDSRRTSGVNDIAELMFSPLHRKPKFMLEDTEKPANEIGTLYHLIMSKLDLDAIRQYGADLIDSELERLIAIGEITDDDLKYIEPSKIKAFFTTELAKRMLNSTAVHREKPFQINIDAKEYDPSLSDISKNEKVILQGIIDCFFEDSDGYVLFDYKTDKVKNNSAEIKDRYKKQLELYKQAIEELTGKPVKETYLYLFDTNEVV